ncbi:MAG: hypothetical protein A2Z18_04720 [Armatimonadetes bacterium RBG_16_58_9]|nr:MAG: hypothetical protein A2Z18_04720 [Armatimonadetes bacterium RBG_16_58_9]
MKISDFESGKASASGSAAEAKILPKDRPKGSVLSRPHTARELSPLEKGMAVAEAALRDVPDTRDDLVADIEERIRKGEYNVSGEQIAEMMLRRRKADKIR